MFPIHCFCNPWKHQKTKIFWCFQRVGKRCIGNKWVKVIKLWKYMIRKIKHYCFRGISKGFKIVGNQSCLYFSSRIKIKSLDCYFCFVQEHVFNKNRIWSVWLNYYVLTYLLSVALSSLSNFFSFFVKFAFQIEPPTSLFNDWNFFHLCFGKNCFFCFGFFFVLFLQ